MTTRATLYNASGVAVGTAAVPLAVLQEHMKHTLQGTNYIANGGRVSVPTQGHLRLTIENPTGSGKRLCITAIDKYCSLSSVIFYKSRVNPTTGLPTTLGVVKNQRVALVAPGTSVAVIKADSVQSIGAPLGGGTLFADHGLVPGRTYDGHTLLVLEPGITFGLGMTFPSAADFVCNIHFFEVAI